MSRGKLDTRVTIRSSVLIWAAELSSIVAVCSWERWQYWPIVHLLENVCFTWCLKGEGPHLVDKHDGENGLVDQLGYTAEEKDIWLNMWPKWGQCVATAKWVRVQQRSTYGKPWILFRMILSWARLQARMGTPVVWKKTRTKKDVLIFFTIVLLILEETVYLLKERVWPLSE